MRFGGWTRLWILVCAVYGLLVFITASISLPTSSDVSHREAYLEALPADARAFIYQPDENAVRVAIELALAKQTGRVIEMPNGYELVIVSVATDEEQAYVAQEYRKILESVVSYRRFSLIMTATLIWALPCAALLLAGLAIRWVYRGFAAAKQR